MRAEFAEVRNDRLVACGLCPHRCVIPVGETGECRARRNLNGELTVDTYGELVAGAADPVEKKPLFHYRPGSLTFSVASLGCNLVCPFCQNHSLSRGLDRLVERFGEARTPRQLVSMAAASQCDSISFTYSEPILMFEFARDVAEIAEENHIGIVFVTNGQATRAAADALGGFLHAANVDLKSFSKAQYRDVLGGSLPATLRTIERFLEAGVWVEVTTLLIPGFNDDDETLRAMARFLHSLNPDIPWHVSRFHPAHLWADRPATPAATLSRARDIGLGQGLRYVYTGNLPGDAGEKTRCPGCGVVLIDRVGFQVRRISIDDAQCPSCGEAIAGRELV